MVFDAAAGPTGTRRNADLDRAGGVDSCPSAMIRAQLVDVRGPVLAAATPVHRWYNRDRELGPPAERVGHRIFPRLLRAQRYLVDQEYATLIPDAMISRCVSGRVYSSSLASSDLRRISAPGAQPDPHRPRFAVGPCIVGNGSYQRMPLRG